MIHWVLQGSLLAPILFSIYLNDLFFLLNDIGICNFADNTTVYMCDVNLKSIVRKLEDLAVTWFGKNYMKLNADKYHLTVSGAKYEDVCGM